MRVPHTGPAAHRSMKAPDRLLNEPLRCPPSPPMTRMAGTDTAFDRARQLCDRHPATAEMLLAALARDHAPDGLDQALVRLYPLVQQADEHLATLGPAGYQALQRRLEKRPPWIDARTVLAQALSPRLNRDLERSMCYHDSSHSTSAAELAAPRIPFAEHQPICGPQLRVRTATQAVAAALLVAALPLGANAAQRGDQQALMGGGASTGLTGLCRPGAARAVAATGAATVMSGLTLWATVAVSRSGNASPEPATPLAPLHPSTALNALRYLDQQRDGQGDTLLQKLLWRQASDPAEPAWLLADLPADSQTHLQDLIGTGTPLGPWLAALLALHEPTGASPAPVATLRRARNADHATGPASPAVPPASVQVAACRAISPATQPLSEVEAATGAITTPALIAQVPDSALGAFASCLQALRGSLQHKQRRLRAQMDGDTGSPLLHDADALRRATLGRLITRTASVEVRVERAVMQTNAQILRRAG